MSSQVLSFGRVCPLQPEMYCENDCATCSFTQLRKTVVRLTSQKEIALMEVETRLDRIQCQIRKGQTEKAYKEARIALGQVRSVLEYHKANRQKTLVPHTLGHRAGACKGVKRFVKREAV